MSKPLDVLSTALVGMWWLESRIDIAADDSRREEPSLGSDPLGVLVYSQEKFAAQFMKRDRSNMADKSVASSGNNNTAAVGGYDAYFGSYRVDADTGDVVHKLEGALSPENVGMEVSRTLSVEGNQLLIKLATTTGDNEPVTRILTWKRVG